MTAQTGKGQPKHAICKVCGWQTTPDIFGQVSAAEHLRRMEDEGEPHHVAALRTLDRKHTHVRNTDPCHCDATEIVR